MKNILLDCTTLSKKIDGLTQYTMSVILELLKLNDDKFTIIFRQNELPENYVNQLTKFSNRIVFEEVNIKTIGPIRDITFALWYRKNRKRFDLFYEPSAQYPFGVKGGIYTIHDILYEEFPEKLGKFCKLKKLYLHFVVRRGLKKANKIIAVSNFTKNEICKYHGNRFTNKIDVIYEGFEHLKNIKIDENDNFVSNLLNFNKNYFLYIGSSRGHKNLHNLFLAFEKADLDWKLLVIGRMDRLDETDKILVERINKNDQKIIFTGWINDAQMYGVLSKANAFVFPSKSEGFGIPILESWYFNVPLLCSNIPVFNEIAKDACITFDPFDIDDIANVLQSFTKKTKDQYQLLIEKQNKYLKNYSWHETAKKINNIFMENIKQ